MGTHHYCVIYSMLYYSVSTTLRFPFKPVCLPTPVTSQGISYLPILLYPTHAALAAAAFLTARNLDLYIQDFVSISTYSPYVVMNPRPITRGHLWLAFTPPFFRSRGVSVYSRLQRAVSVPEIALRFLQRSIRGSVSGRYPFIPLLEISVRKVMAFPSLLPLCRFFPRRVYMRQRVAAQ